MKRVLAIAVCLLALSLSAAAQIDEPVEYDFRGRISAEIDKRIVSGFHISLSEEFRMKDNFTAVDRFYTSLGLSYKPCPYFKLGLSYTLMNIHDWSSDSESWSWKMRHRTNLDLSGMYRTGNLKFNLRERLQYTYKMGEMNSYQSPRNELMLRSRLKISYEFQSKPVEPYFSVELRNTLNAVSYSSYTHTIEPGDNVLYNDAYISRVRLQPGVSWRLSRRSSLDFYLLGDYVFEKDYDANKQGDLKFYKNESGEYVYDGNGNQLYCIFYERGWHFSLGIGYSFAF